MNTFLKYTGFGGPPVATSIGDRDILLVMAEFFLSLLSDDLQIQFFSLWLDVRSLATLDVAVSSRRLRPSWLTVLRCVRSYALGRFQVHSLSSLTWLSKRGIISSSVFLASSVYMKINCNPVHPDGDILILDTNAVVRIGHPIKRNNKIDQSIGDVVYCFGKSDFLVIELARCDQVTDAGVIALGAFCGNLQSIDLARCEKVTDAGVVALSAVCGKLQYISLAFCDQLTDAGVIALGAGCGQLQSINLTCCDKVTDAGVIALGAGCGKLQSISLAGCSKVTDAGLIALGAGCGQLQSIDLAGCWKVTNAGFEALAAGCGQLQSINLTGCWKLAMEGVEKALGLGCHHL